MTTIHFETKLFTLGSWVVLQLPHSASVQLPSRGQTMVEGTINGVAVHTPLEPDGRGSHWLHLDQKLLMAIKAGSGDTVAVVFTPTKVWPEPPVPADIRKALDAASPQIRDLWQSITPMARWEWIRWIRATNSQETRQRRIVVGISKMKAGERRPCCWNRNLSTEPSVSKQGVLLEPVT